MAKTVQALLEDVRLLGEEQFLIVQAVRELLRQKIEPLSEEVKYGGILFASGVPFCGVFAYKEHVSVEFSQGAKIKDAEGSLEGSGQGRRHIKLRSVDDLAAKKLAAYLPLSLKAAEEGLSRRSNPARATRGPTRS